MDGDDGPQPARGIGAEDDLLVPVARYPVEEVHWILPSERVGIRSPRARSPAGSVRDGHRTPRY
jgi:hypothetical protein